MGISKKFFFNESFRAHITIASEENRQRIFVDGRLIHDFIDNGKPCLSEVGWQHSLPCNNTSSIPRHGAIGIRHTQKQKALYDNFKIYTLIEN
jgi:hypothetical protein